MADRVIMPRALDANGDPVAGARAYFYEVNTTTPLTVYANQAGTTPHLSPVYADADGVFPAVYTTTNLRLDIWSTYGDDSSLPGFPSDYWYKTAVTSSNAAATTFTPITGNTATNVQTAITNLTAKWNAVTSWALDFLTSATASAARTKLGLGTVATYAFIDEDSMASNSAVSVPSQQSVKAYADSLVPAVGVVARGVLDTDNATLQWAANNGFSATVTDNGTGDYSVNFPSALSSSGYAVAITADGAGGTGGRFFFNVRNRTTTGFDILAVDVSGVAADPTQISVTVSL